MLTFLEMIEVTVYLPAFNFKDRLSKTNPSFKLLKTVAIILPILFFQYALIFSAP